MASDFSLDNKLNKAFEYSLRVSHRVKHAKLQIKPYGGLEVVIPVRFPKKAVPSLVLKHADWINRQLQKQQIQFPDPGLPDSIQLTINGEITQVTYAEDEHKNPGDNYLHINAHNVETRVHRLRQWVRKQAWLLLPPMLEQVAAQTGLTYKKISIRSQKTRWGSCSTSGTISVNDQLLFVPRATAEYLMVHELCHTRHLNHSAKFWALVAQHCPDYRQHEQVLNRARNLIPDWFLKDVFR